MRESKEEILVKTSDKPEGMVFEIELFLDLRSSRRS
jgi:hypothetical protein